MQELPTILPVESSNAFDDLSADYKAGRNVWREVTDMLFDYAHNVLPPIDHNGKRFMLGEPYTHGQRGAVYAGFIRVGERYFARNVARVDFAANCYRLILAVEAGS